MAATVPLERRGTVIVVPIFYAIKWQEYVQDSELRRNCIVSKVVGKWPKGHRKTKFDIGFWFLLRLACFGCKHEHIGCQWQISVVLNDDKALGAMCLCSLVKRYYLLQL